MCGRKRPWAIHLVLMLSYLTLLVLIMFFLRFMQSGPAIDWRVHAFGYAATAGLLATTAYALYGRLRKREPHYKHSHETDWIFLILLAYVTGTGGPSPSCIFCDACLDEAAADRRDLVLIRGRSCYVILNLYPYNNGHLMVVPNRHIPSLAAASDGELDELMRLTRDAEIALTEAYAPQGINVGINLGRPAGAGVVDHVHIHLVPRWSGDTNFMSVVGNVRVLPEELGQTAARLRPIFERLATTAP